VIGHARGELAKFGQANKLDQESSKSAGFLRPNGNGRKLIANMPVNGKNELAAHTCFDYDYSLGRGYSEMDSIVIRTHARSVVGKGSDYANL
jgi:hypothetical protein